MAARGRNWHAPVDAAREALLEEELGDVAVRVEQRAEHERVLAAAARRSGAVEAHLHVALQQTELHEVLALLRERLAGRLRGVRAPAGGRRSGRWAERRRAQAGERHHHLVVVTVVERQVHAHRRRIPDIFHHSYKAKQ